MTLRSINPANETTIQEYEEYSREQVEAILARAYQVNDSWSSTSYTKRAALLMNAAHILESQKDAWATLMTQEMGKTITGARAEIEKCAWVCRYYAEHGASFLADEPVATDATQSLIRYEPLGTVLAIMPWNFPFWQVFRFAAPALIAGNTAILKHASNVPGCTLALEHIFLEAGFPQGIFSSLLISASRVQSLIADRRITAVTLTGSNAAGSNVAATAGTHFKKTVLELGGSDPFIVLEDADIDAAAKTAIASRTVNTGQSCIAAKRFIVVSSRYDAFIELCANAMQSLIIGDPLQDNTQIGPLARRDIRDTLHTQVSESIKNGGRLVCGGHIPDRAGYFYEPTLVTDVKKGMPLYDEETFGPVAAVIRATDTDDAIRIANDTIYGLGASLWTQDMSLAAKCIPRIQAGAVFVNGMVKSDPRLPFGGIKDSGYGRELGKPGIHEFVNKKAVWIA